MLEVDVRLEQQVDLVLEGFLGRFVQVLGLGRSKGRVQALEGLVLVSWEVPYLGLKFLDPAFLGLQLCDQKGDFLLLGRKLFIQAVDLVLEPCDGRGLGLQTFF